MYIFDLEKSLKEYEFQKYIVLMKKGWLLHNGVTLTLEVNFHVCYYFYVLSGHEIL